ncbi:MAG TPA: STAS domain-containing protein [Thermoanaerobaculia bacterium]|nr:STAS domain-containing protein [Thermoanaerobaculia bacterium]
MNIDFDITRGVTVAKLHERRLDAAGAPDLKSRIGRRIAEGERLIVLDMTPVEFVDSTGLSAILSALKGVAPDGKLALAGCRPVVLELLKLTRLDRILQHFPTAEEATQSIAIA